jgi:diaminopimelate decarboxylase
MDHFLYHDGRLCAEAVPVSHIADEVGTPFYCYSTATIERHFGVFTDAVAGRPATVCYAVKANGNIAVVGTLARLGAGADVVSGGELARALAAGVPASKVVFSGVGKSADEMAQALDAGVMQINVESEPELAVLDQVATARGVRANVAIRVNPDVDALTHAKITTGKSENKFGIGWSRAREVYARGAAMPGIRMAGLAMHIGSQVTDLAPFGDAIGRLRDLAAALRADGLNFERLDLGGGLGIPYGPNPAPSPAEYGAMVRSTLGDFECEMIFEPGRVLVGNAGILVTRVLYVKEGATRRFVVVDAAMNDLMRPVLYDAYHTIVPVAESNSEAEMTEVDVVGPICESGDTFAVRRPMADVGPGDLLAIRTAGAYCATMSSTYNARPLVPEVLVRGDAFAVVRQRLSVADMLARETLPEWLPAP